MNERLEDADVDPFGYARELEDDELAELQAHVGGRLQSLLAQGIPIPVAQIENHHLIGLLEAMVGKAKSLRVREWHLSWLDRQLDAAEAAVRAQVLQTGLFSNDADDLPGFP